MSVKRYITRILLWLGLLIGLFFGIVLFCNLWIKNTTKHQVINNIEEMPEHDIGLVLGTTRRLRGGYKNPYFYNRIEAAFQLYQAGKVKHLIVSGDNRYLTYNEPVDMKKALMERGIPEESITLDYAGFRTLDSVVRCWAVFQQKKFTIISQQFHNYRALYIANYYELETVAFSAQEVRTGATKMIMREWLARCKAVLDLYILKKKPKFLGKKIDVRIK